MRGAYKWGHFASFMTKKSIFVDIVKFNVSGGEFSTVKVDPGRTFITLNAIIHTINSTYLARVDILKRTKFIIFAKL